MLTTIARSYLTVATPIILVLLSVRLVMSPLFLHFEYNRPGFPDDPFGLTREQRLTFAPYALDYLIYNEPLDYLADLRFEDDSVLFNERELRHMADVQVVTQIAFILLGILSITAILAGVYLWRTDRNRLRFGLLQGAVFTLAIIASIIIVAILSWDFFFVAFHTLFFESGTWYFAYSDTLIRLFPEQFWFDAAIIIGGLSTASALFMLSVTWWWGRSALTARGADDTLSMAEG